MLLKNANILIGVLMKKLLPLMGVVRLDTILKIIPVDETTWWAGVKTGIFPEPIRLSRTETAWDVEDIRKYINKHPNIK